MKVKGYMYPQMKKPVGMLHLETINFADFPVLKGYIELFLYLRCILRQGKIIIQKPFVLEFLSNYMLSQNCFPDDKNE